MKTKTTAIADRVLWLGSGDTAMKARVTLYPYGEDTFEVYAELGGEVPRRYVGSLTFCINFCQRFIDSLLASGWTNPMCEASTCMILPDKSDPKPILAERWNRRQTN